MLHTQSQRGREGGMFMCCVWFSGQVLSQSVETTAKRACMDKPQSAVFTLYSSYALAQTIWTPSFSGTCVYIVHWHRHIEHTFIIEFFNMYDLACLRVYVLWECLNDGLGLSVWAPHLTRPKQIHVRCPAKNPPPSSPRTIWEQIVS